MPPPAPPQRPVRPPCDLWEYGVDQRGVAVHRSLGPNNRPRVRNAARIFWEIAHDACLLPRSVLVMSCGDKRCVEPRHAQVLSVRQAAQRPRRSRLLRAAPAPTA